MLIKKHFFNVILCAFFSTHLTAQQTPDALKVAPPQTTDTVKIGIAVQNSITPKVADTLTRQLLHTKNNILKFNLSALLVNNYSFQYERKFSKRFSIAANFQVRSFTTLPFIDNITKAANNPAINFNTLRLGSAGVTPEIRYYVGKKAALHGFYVGAMFNNTNYNVAIPITYSGYSGIFSGQLNSQSVGLQLGAQWQLSKRLFLDWWILGPSYGAQKGNLVLSASNLSPMQQGALNAELHDLKTNDQIFKNFIDSYSVNANGAVINSKGPWGAIRAFGINLGFAF